MNPRVLLPLLALAASATYFATAADTKPPLPSDLAAVPAKATLVVSIRPADVWASPAAKAARDKLGKGAAAFDAVVLKMAGVAPTDVERATFYTDDVVNGNYLVAVVRFKEKPDAKAVTAKLVPRGKEMKAAGKTYVADEARFALTWIDDRTFAYGMLGQVRDLLEGGPGNGKGTLGDVVSQAAGNKAMVAGVADPKLAESADKLPESLAPLAGLVKHERMTLSVDLAGGLKVSLGGAFADEAGATAALKSAEAGRKLLVSLAESTAGLLAADKDKVNQALGGLLREAAGAVRAAKVEAKGKTLTASAVLKTDPVVLGSVGVEAAKKVNEAAARSRSANNLKQIAIAMHGYADAHGSFPAAATYDKDGKPLLSWRVMILPFLDQEALFKEFLLDEPWDSAHNKKLIAKMPKVFAAPAGEYAEGTTPYQGFVGAGSFFTGRKGTKFADITDGTSITIMVADSAPGVEWTKPGDMPFDVAKDAKVPAGMFAAGFNAAMCDGSVRFLSKGVTAKALKALITRAGGE